LKPIAISYFSVLTDCWEGAGCVTCCGFGGGGDTAGRMFEGSLGFIPRTSPCSGAGPLREKVWILFPSPARVICTIFGVSVPRFFSAIVAVLS